jgi:hypothetical protein
MRGRQCNSPDVITEVITVKTASKVALIVIPVLAIAFSLFEWGGAAGWAPWDTISWYAQRNFALDVFVGGLFGGGGLVGVLWWIHHMRQPIYRLIRRIAS